MKTKLTVEMITQVINPNYNPPLRYVVRLLDPSGLAVSLENCTATQMLPFAKIDDAGVPCTRRDGSVEAGDTVFSLETQNATVTPAPDAAPPAAPAPATIDPS